MKRIGILTAGGDTPALNATLHGAAARANDAKVELIGLLGGFNGLLDREAPYVRLNPLFETIPELDSTLGGTVLGSSRRYVSSTDQAALDSTRQRINDLKLDGLVCVGGDGTINGMQPLCDLLPTVLAPKTIDNDLGLNSVVPLENQVPGDDFDLTQMVNYATPGFATAVYVATWGIRRIRTTAESHHRIAIVEVMGRHSGYIAAGSAYGQPDIILIPEAPVSITKLVDRVREIYNRQKNVVIVCGEGIIDEEGVELGASHATTDPAGNTVLSGAAEALRNRLIEAIGDDFFQQTGRVDTAERAIFTRKVGHTQRGGRPLKFDRYQGTQLGGQTIEMLLAGRNNCFASLQLGADGGFEVEPRETAILRDDDGVVHARRVHPSFYCCDTLNISAIGIEYLLPIFSEAIGADDVEHVRQSLFDASNLKEKYRSISVAIARRAEFVGRE